MKTTQNIIAALLMKKNKRWFYAVLIISFTSACRPKEVTPSEYIPNWATYKEEVTDKQIAQDIEMKLTYNPIELLILNELEGSFSQSRYNKSKQNFCDHFYFTLDIANTPLSKKTGSDIKKYFIRDRQSQFSLFVGNDSIPCALYHPELLSDIEKQARLNLVFPRPVSCDSIIKQDLRVIFREDNTLSNKVVQFLIKSEKINQLPKIKF